ncbi:MAG TPA: Na+/H+ antiporter [Pseudonocardia sp.]|jgi:CPA1 family monovalent cation:H+ antiporter|nr:Na+/H+ antiporter [Pseudonocardia sp.]
MPSQVFLVGIALSVAILIGRLLSRRLGIPEAAAYVLVGIVVGLLPGFGQVRLSPEIVLLVFLPPLVYYAAFFSDLREAVEHIVPVIGQSVGLVLVSAGAAAAAVMAVFPDVGWAAALAFGAAIAPPDPVAATSVLQRLGVPRRLVTVLEGEGLVNDGVALTLFAIAVSNVGRTPGPGEMVLQVVIEVVGGVVFGLLVGMTVMWVRAHTADSPSQVVISLVTPYLAFIPAHLMHASGILATVVAAAWLGTRGRGLVTPTSRMETETFWRVLNLVLVALLFVLLGLQVPGIIAVVRGYSIGTLLAVSAAVVLVVVVVRIVWAAFVPPLVARLPIRHSNAPAMSRRERLVLGWCGPRGAVSLAVALSIPLTGAAGLPFPRRELLLFLTIVVVLATLVGQVLPLPVLVRRLRLTPSEDERTEGLRARRTAVDAALCELDDISGGREHPEPAVDALRQVMQLRRERLMREVEALADGDDEAADEHLDERRLWLRLLEIERRSLRRLHDEGEIGSRTLVEVSQELDLDETRLRQAT